MAGDRRVPDGDTEAIATVAAFLVHLEIDRPRMMYGSWTATEAVEAFSHLLGCKPAKLREIAEAGSRRRGG